STVVSPANPLMENQSGFSNRKNPSPSCGSASTFPKFARNEKNDAGMGSSTRNSFMKEPSAQTLCRTDRTIRILRNLPHGPGRDPAFFVGRKPGVAQPYAPHSPFDCPVNERGAMKPRSDDNP